MGNRKVEVGTSKYKGVSWDRSKSKWVARIGVNGKSLQIGRFMTETEAAIAYDKAAFLYFKEFANLNFSEVEDVV